MLAFWLNWCKAFFNPLEEVYETAATLNLIVTACEVSMRLTCDPAMGYVRLQKFRSFEESVPGLGELRRGCLLYTSRCV